MVEYMDKIVGKIAQELKAQGIEDNTLIMFVGDNGTSRNLVTKTNFGDVKGAKGNTITHGVHVPMIASWPSKIKNPIIYDGVVDLTDFYATFSDILNLSNDSDGKSLTHIFFGNKKNDPRFYFKQMGLLICKTIKSLCLWNCKNWLFFKEPGL